ncbi:MAG TPA: hypothetical protein VIX91_22450 [Candidatus Acidoferrum sp.]
MKPLYELLEWLLKVLGGAMKYAGLKKYRWLFFALAAIGIIQTPFAILSAISEARADHRLILPLLLALTIRFAMLGFFSKIWWDTRSSSETSSNLPSPTKQ